MPADPTDHDLPADSATPAAPTVASTDRLASGATVSAQPAAAQPAFNAAAPSDEKVSFSRVRQLIRSRTLDLLAIAIIALGLIAIGGHLTNWWDTDAEQLSNPLLTAQELVGLDTIWGADGTAVQLDFGNSPYSLRKEIVTGNAEAAVDALLDRCETIVRSSTDNVTSRTPAETRLLKLVEAAKPIRESETGDWALYRIEYPTTMIVGTRETVQTASPSPRRIICWGIALPIADRWTLFTIQPAVGQSADGHPDIPLPPEAFRTLSLREASGAFLMGFTGEASIQEWSLFFTKQAQHFGWETSEAWNQRESSAAARYLFETESGSFWIDVQLTRSRKHRLTGLVSVIPRVH